MSEEKAHIRVVRYKLLPRHRRAKQPVAQAGQVEICFTMNLDEMYRLMNLVNPRAGLQQIIPEE